MRVRALLSIVVLVCSAGACTGSAKPVRPRATPGDVLRTDERAPLPFGAKPLWTERAKGVPRYADSFALRGERVVVVSGPKGGEADRLSVLDAASGRVRWSTRIWTPLRGGGGDEWNGPAPDDDAPQVVDRDGDWGVLVHTTRKGDARAYGLALLSGEDGHVLWRRSLSAAVKAPARIYPSLTLTDAHTAVVNLRPYLGGTAADLRLVAVDTRTGKPLWTRTGIRLTAVAPGSVLATEWPDPASRPIDADTGTGTVAALDAATGRTRWSLRERMAAARVAAVAGGVLLVRPLQSGRLAAPVLLDLATGGELDRAPAGTGNCADDRTTLIACDVEDPGPSLVTIRSGDRRIRTAAHPPPNDAIISLVRDGRIYYSGGDTAGAEIDRSGTPLTGPLPDGFLTALSAEYAVLRFPKNQGYQVYRVG